MKKSSFSVVAILVVAVAVMSAFTAKRATFWKKLPSDQSVSSFSSAYNTASIGTFPKNLASYTDGFGDCVASQTTTLCAILLDENHDGVSGLTNNDFPSTYANIIGYRYRE